VGGGRIHGPRPRDYSVRVPVQVRRLALQSALADRAQGSGLLVVEDLHLEAPKTKAVVTLLAAMGLAGRKVLVVTQKTDTNLLLSCRNLPRTEVSNTGELNAYEIMRADAVVFTRSALTALGEVLGR
jgi:large subunit ribosomal protein L4